MGGYLDVNSFAGDEEVNIYFLLSQCALTVWQVGPLRRNLWTWADGGRHFPVSKMVD